METNIEKNIDLLESRVAPYSEPVATTSSSRTVYLEYIYKYKIYIGIFALVIFLLIYVKPFFVMIKMEKDKKLSVKKLIISWIVIGSILSIAFFFYSKRGVAHL